MHQAQPAECSMVIMSVLVYVLLGIYNQHYEIFFIWIIFIIEYIHTNVHRDTETHTPTHTYTHTQTHTHAHAHEPEHPSTQNTEKAHPVTLVYNEDT